MTTPLTVYFSHDITGAPVWTSDAHSSAPTAKRMSEVLLETGWDGATPLRFVGCDLEPCRLSDWHRAEHGGKLPTNLAKFQRDAKMREHMANGRDPFKTGLSDSALGYGSKRPDYGTTKRID